MDSGYNDLAIFQMQRVNIFRLFTKESLTKIQRKIMEEQRNECVKEGQGDELDMMEPDPSLEAGCHLPMKMANDFPPELFGKPIEDLDEFYQNKYVSMCMLSIYISVSWLIFYSQVQFLKNSQTKA